MFPLVLQLGGGHGVHVFLLMTAVHVSTEQLLELYIEQKIGTFIFIMII